MKVRSPIGTWGRVEKNGSRLNAQEARVCDMHRAGTWTGSKSLIFAIRVEKFQPGFTRQFFIPTVSVAYRFDAGLAAWIVPQLVIPIALR
jgi:hypothetical protein